MNTTEVKKIVSNFVSELIFKSVEPEEKLISTKTLDSISLVDLAVAIEESFNIEIPLSEMKVEEFDTINLMTTYILNKMK
jgi:acyl carrier protein